MATSEKSDGSKDKQAKLKQQMLNLEDKENRWTYFTFFFSFKNIYSAIAYVTSPSPLRKKDC